MATILKSVATKTGKFCNRHIIACPNRSLFKKKPVKSKNDDPFIIVRAGPEDTEDILNLMWDSYYPEETCVRTLGLGNIRSCVLDQEAIKHLCKGNSFLARCKYNGCVVGAAVNAIECPWDPDHAEKLACTLSCPKMCDLFMFWAHLQRAPNLWKKYCQQHIFEIAHLVVQKDNRNKGVAMRLMERSLDLAGDAGYRVIRVDATNAHVASNCEKLKMKLVYEIPYCSYLGGPKLKPIFDVPPPNDTVKTYILMPHAAK